MGQSDQITSHRLACAVQETLQLSQSVGGRALWCKQVSSNLQCFQSYPQEADVSVSCFQAFERFGMTGSKALYMHFTGASIGRGWACLATRVLRRMSKCIVACIIMGLLLSLLRSFTWTAQPRGSLLLCQGGLASTGST